MSQSPLHKQFFISDLEWFVMTPILLKQFRLFYDQKKPIGVVFWAYASPEVAKRLAEGASKLRPQDWKASDPDAPATQIWVVEVIAPFGGAEDIHAPSPARCEPAPRLSQTCCASTPSAVLSVCVRRRES